MTDYRVDCPIADQALLDQSVSGCLNVLGPAPGRAAAESQTLSDGTVFPAVPAAGDQTRVYVAVRGAARPDFPASAVESSQADSEAVLGIWAGDAA